MIIYLERCKKNLYCDEIYSDNYISTIGVDYKVKTI